MTASPFAVETEKPFVALLGKRNGYIQVATTTEATTYAELNPRLMLVAYHWCQQLEALGAKRVYWITLSEAVPHLHVHLYPRWFANEVKGVELFNQRENEPQPLWNEPTKKQSEQWAEQYNVHMINI